MKQQLYFPKEEWTYHDFEINKHYWIKHGMDKCLDIRMENLFDLINILNENQVDYWLQGKTLLGIFKYQKLLDDHDDDIGIFFSDRNIILGKIYKDLLDIGFKKNRETNNIISFERNYRYLDLCLFKSKSNKKIGYNNKSFYSHHFLNFDYINWRNNEIKIPSDTIKLLEQMYPYEMNSFINKVKFYPINYFRKIKSKFNNINSIWHRFFF